MPRLSLFKPERGKDYEFLDNTIYEMFTIGGTEIHVHKYLGSENPSDSESTADQPQYDAVSETNIQDLLFLENRDRKYDSAIYNLRAIYNVQDQDFDLSQFGLFISNDILFLTIHIRNSVKTLGRKPIPGDVIELPHLKDEYALNDYSAALKRYYVIEEINRASEGFSPTWWPHLYRIKLKQIYDSQEYNEILDLPANADENDGTTLRDLMSTYNKELEINNAVVAQAEADALKSGYDVSHYYTLAVDDLGVAEISIAEDSTGIISSEPVRDGYQGYLLGTGTPPNGSQYGSGIQFPDSPADKDYFLRTDFLPNRLFQYDGTRWFKVSSDVRVTLSNTDDRNTQKGTFINNDNVNTIGGEQVPERQSVSKALRPRADN